MSDSDTPRTDEAAFVPQGEFYGTDAVHGDLARSLERELATAVAERDAIKLQAQCHAQEARTANSTIAEIYRLCTGKTGEPGNWNGAEPVRQLLAQLQAAEADALLYRKLRNIAPWVSGLAVLRTEDVPDDTGMLTHEQLDAALSGAPHA